MFGETSPSRDLTLQTFYRNDFETKLGENRSAARRRRHRLVRRVPVGVLLRRPSRQERQGVGGEECHRARKNQRKVETSST